MRFAEVPLEGAFLIEPEPVADERGFFLRTWDRQAFLDRGLDAELAQCSVSYSACRGTLRGLHFQAKPFDETKLVRCTRGSVFDVIVDLRASQPTFGRWYSVELSAENHRSLYIPKGFAHGFQTLTDDVEFAYQMSAVYSVAHARGVRWNDPAFGIDWPATDHRILSSADRTWPLVKVAA